MRRGDDCGSWRFRTQALNKFDSLLRVCTQGNDCGHWLEANDLLVQLFSIVSTCQQLHTVVS